MVSGSRAVKVNTILIHIYSFTLSFPVYKKTIKHELVCCLWWQKIPQQLSKWCTI